MATRRRPRVRRRHRVDFELDDRGRRFIRAEDERPHRGIAGLVAGALSMAVGEYVSVSSQRDAEEADIDLEKRELASTPEAELNELASIYEKRGLDKDLAMKVAMQLSATTGWVRTCATSSASSKGRWPARCKRRGSLPRALPPSRFFPSRAFCWPPRLGAFP